GRPRPGRPRWCGAPGAAAVRGQRALPRVPLPGLRRAVGRAGRPRRPRRPLRAAPAAARARGGGRAGMTALLALTTGSDRPAPSPGASRAEVDRFLLRTFRHHSRTFSLAAKLLPRPVRLPIATVYLYCRTIDTLADEH